jgi:hypothetical protein
MCILSAILSHHFQCCRPLSRDYKIVMSSRPSHVSHNYEILCMDLISPSRCSATILKIFVSSHYVKFGHHCHSSQRFTSPVPSDKKWINSKLLQHSRFIVSQFNITWMNMFAPSSRHCHDCTGNIALITCICILLQRMYDNIKESVEL